MFRYVVALLALVAMLSLPVSAQDGIKKAGPCAPTKDEVAPIKTFTICSFSLVEKGDVKFALLVKEDGSAQCVHNVETETPGMKKTVETTVSATLTAEELKSIREAFARLDITTLETVPHDDEPEKFIGIKATNGSAIGSYYAVVGQYGLFTARVEQFMKVANKIGDRLK